MKTRLAAIYHCLNCGRVRHLERQNEAPTCCGVGMVHAADETIWEPEEDDVVDTPRTFRNDAEWYQPAN